MKRILLFLAAAFFILFAIRAWRSGENDFVAYYHAGARVLQGHSPYVVEATPFRYLPLTAYFFAPFSVLPFHAARMLFFFVNFAAAVAIYAGIFRRLGGLAALLLVALFIRFHNHDFQNAQVNPILLFLFFYWWKARKESLPLATLAFAIFASFKITPFAIGLALLYEKRWNEISWIALWTVVLNFLPVFLIENGPFVFKDWYDQAKVLGYPVPMMQNIQSLPSALWWNLQDRLNPETFLAILRPLEAALLGLVVFLSPKKPEENRFAWMSAGILAMTVLLAPLAWKHNYLQFLPLAYLWFREDPDFWETRTRVLYAAAMIGMVLLPSALSTWDRYRADHLYLMVWSGLGVLLLTLKYFRSRSGSGNRLRPAEA